MPPFVPYPPDSLRQSGSRRSSSSDDSARLHYSKVWVAALKLGYSRRDLANMSYGEVIFDLAAINDEGSTRYEQEPDVVDATQEDIRTMLG